MKKEILILIIGALIISCGSKKRGTKGDRGNKTIVYEVEGQAGPRGEKGDKGDSGEVGLQGPEGKPGIDGTSCEVKSENDGTLIICANSVAKVSNGVGCSATETPAGVEVICANGKVFLKNGAQGPVGPIGPTGPQGAQGQPGRDGQIIVVPQPRYSKSCYTYIDSCDECGNTYRYHIYYKALTMPNGDVLGQICEGYNVTSTNCTQGQLTQATLTLGDPRYSVAPVASQYTTARLIDPLRAEITYRGRAFNVSCSGN